MRMIFIFLLKLSAWLSPVALLVAALGAPDSIPKPAAVLLAFLLGGLAYVWYSGLADLAESAWGSEERDAKITHLLEVLGQRLEQLAGPKGTLAEQLDELSGDLAGVLGAMADKQEVVVKKMEYGQE
jgi:hypothetical protein